MVLVIAGPSNTHATQNIIVCAAPSNVSVPQRDYARRNWSAHAALTTAFVPTGSSGSRAMHILWVIIIGFVAGLIARLLAPGSNNPAGFILRRSLALPARS